MLLKFAAIGGAVFLPISPPAIAAPQPPQPMISDLDGSEYAPCIKDGINSSCPLSLLAAKGAENTYRATQTINPPTNGVAIDVNQSYAGSGSEPRGTEFSINSDTYDAANGNLIDVSIDDLFGGSSVTGGRAAIWANLTRTAATSASNTNRNYVGIQAQEFAAASDGGTGLTAATSKGSEFGASSAQISRSGATDLSNTTAEEFNSRMEAGSSVYAKSIIQLSGQPQDQVQGAVVDAMIWLYDQNGAVGHNSGILFDAVNNQWPIHSGGTIIGTNGGSAAHGIDLSASTFTSDAYRSPGFVVKPSGGVSATGVTINGGVFRPGQTTYADLRAADPTPQVGDMVNITDASTCTANTRITAGGGSAHSCAAIYSGVGWIALATH
jgi:hypothetical protein